jgi:hypothetical protein
MHAYMQHQTHNTHLSNTIAIPPPRPSSPRPVTPSPPPELSTSTRSVALTALFVGINHGKERAADDVGPQASSLFLAGVSRLFRG